MSDLVTHRRVLVTGGAGFLGRHLANRLASDGWDVTVLDNLSTANASFEWPELKHPRIQLVHGSTLDSNLVKTLVRDHSRIVHFASIVGVGETINHPIETAENLVGTLSVVKAVRPDDVLIFGSSADVYGIHSLYHDGPMMEEDDVAYEHALVNRWIYPKIKALEESVVAASDARTISIRIFNAYGADMDFPDAKRVIPQFIRQIFRKEPIRIHGSGHQVRSFCYYTDMIEGFVRCLDYASELKPKTHETMNMGDDHGVSVLNLAKLLIRLAIEEQFLDGELSIETEQKAFYSQRFNDAWDRIPDLTRIRAKIGFQQKTGLEEGLRLTLRGCYELHRSKAS